MAKVKQKKTALYDRITYALYYADELLMIGSINEMSEALGTKALSVAYLKTPSYVKYREQLPYEKQRFLIEC